MLIINEFKYEYLDDIWADLCLIYLSEQNIDFSFNRNIMLITNWPLIDQLLNYWFFEITTKLVLQSSLELWRRRKMPYQSRQPVI